MCNPVVPVSCRDSAIDLLQISLGQSTGVIQQASDLVCIVCYRMAIGGGNAHCNTHTYIRYKHMNILNVVIVRILGNLRR